MLRQAVDGVNTFTASQLFASQRRKRAAGANEKRVNTYANSPNLQGRRTYGGPEGVTTNGRVGVCYARCARGLGHG